MSGLLWADAISLLNGTAVGVFGMLLTAAFCEIVWTKQRKYTFAFCMVLLLLFQGVVYICLEPVMVELLYPLITHLPLVVVIYLFSKKKIWAFIAVFVAYLCCQLRRWLALLLVALFFDNQVMMQEVMEIALTIPLLWVIIRFVAPAVASLSRDTIAMQLQFGIVPVLAYAFDYLTQVYSGWFPKGSPVVTEFMFFVCSGAYLMFVLHTSKETKQRFLLEKTQENLNLQITQAVREVQLLRESQNQARIYRHDLRHHLQYIASCIENGNTEHATEYIRGICAEIEAGKVTAYCENEAANLIFSAFAVRADEQAITLKIHAELGNQLPVSENDLCVLLSNALENALHACQKLKAEGRDSFIEVVTYEKNRKLFVQIENSCSEESVCFSQGVPVTEVQGHGLGVRSICALVERYHGIYTFSVKNNRFTLRISI